MSTEVYEEKVIKLINGTEIKVRPLKISLLRPFMKKFEGIAAVAEDNDKSLSLLMECVHIAMQQYNPEIAGDLKALEETLDLPTVYKIVEEASGVKLSDASLLTNLK
jgi:hypothetical protein